MKGRHSPYALAMFLLLVTWCQSCGDVEEGSDDTPASEREQQTTEHPSEPIERSTGSGPVRATIRLTPAAPRLGDSLVLTLEVEAEADVEVELPDFGEALGRFQIVDFTPNHESAPDGGIVASQRHTLLAPMSGRQRIPPLRVVFVDRRSGQTQSDREEEHELLTDEIAIEVESVLPDDVADTLRPALGELPPRIASRARDPWAYLGVALLLLATLGAIVSWWRRAARARLQRSAFELAMGRLNSLRSRGLPTPERADDWYVELSDIIRRYLENRFGLRAPELTTEEFLREARRSVELSPEHRTTLSAFLEQCDRVKFAAYRPPGKESLNVLNDAGRFIEETRLAEKTESADGQPTAAES